MLSCKHFEFDTLMGENRSGLIKGHVFPVGGFARFKDRRSLALKADKSRYSHPKRGKRKEKRI